MKRTMRSLMRPSVTRPATPIAIPAIANAYPRRILSTPRLVRSGSQTRLACGCGSYYHSKRDATGWPARRRTQTFTRAIENRIASDARVRHDMRRKAPPESTLNTASSMPKRSEEHTSELQSHSDLVCRLLLEKKKQET